jgi:adenine specific DNA methylase Mod
MLTAKEAYSGTIEILQQRKVKQLEYIHNKILTSMAMGVFSIIVTSIYKEHIELLETKGYIIRRLVNFDYLISWETNCQKMEAQQGGKKYD